MKLRVDTAGVGGIRVEILHTAPDFEKVQKFPRVVLGRDVRGERAIIKRVVLDQSSRGIAAWKAISQIQLQQRRGLQAQAIAVLPWKVMLV